MYTAIIIPGRNVLQKWVGYRRSVDLELGGRYKWNKNRIYETHSERGAEEGLSEKAEVIVWVIGYLIVTQNLSTL